MTSVFESVLADLPDQAYVRARWSGGLSDISTPAGGWVVVDLPSGWSYRPPPAATGVVVQVVGDLRRGAHRAARWPRLRWPRPRLPRTALHMVVSLLIRWTT